MFIIKEEIKESIRKLRRAWSCCWLINPLVYGNISRAGGQLEEERIKIFWNPGICFCNSMSIHVQTNIFLDKLKTILGSFLLT